MRTRIVKILQFLMFQKYPIEMNELAQEFSVSDRTIRSDIQELNTFLSKHDLPKVQTIRNKGVTFDLSPEQRKIINEMIDHVIVDYYSNSHLRVLNLILEFAFGHLENIYEKQAEFEVSKSTIDNDMRMVREILNDYHLLLNTEISSVIQIEGSERAIRVMLFNFINKVSGPIDIYDAAKLQTSEYRVVFQFIPLEDFEKISDLYEQYLKNDDVMYKNQTVLFILIWVNRIKNGNALAKETRKEDSEDKIDFLMNELINIYVLDVNSSERQYLRLILETLVSDTVRTPSVWTKGQIITLELLDHVQKDLNLQLNNQEELFSGLFKHIVKLMSRLENNMQIRNPLTEEIKNNNPKIFKSIQAFDFEFNRKQTVEITDDEIAFLAIYFLVSISQVRQNYTYLYKAVVFCHHGKATGKLLAQMLEENFEIDVVAVLSSTELSLLHKLDVDIAFSTFPLEVNAVPLLVVDSLLVHQRTERVQAFLNQHANRRRRVDKQLIDKQTNSHFFEEILKLIKNSGGKITGDVYEELKNVFHRNHLSLKENAGLPKMTEVLEDSHILYDLKAHHWTDAISKTAQPLLKKEVVTENYVEAMIQAVKVSGPYIVMSPHIALAHAKPEDGVNQIGLSVSRLKQPIDFGHKEDDPIKIVFCIAPVDSYTHTNIMKDIFEMMNNEHKMSKLFESKNKEEFKTILLEQ